MSLYITNYGIDKGSVLSVILKEKVRKSIFSLENTPLNLLNLSLNNKVHIDDNPETVKPEKPKKLNKCRKALKYLLENENATQIEIFNDQVKH